MSKKNKNGFEDSGDKNDESLGRRETSMTTLIIWNMSKALEKNPNIDFRTAINDVQERLRGDTCDLTSIISQNAEQQHLTCALLAWQELGHDNADSLCQFIETTLRKCDKCGRTKNALPSDKNTNKTENECSSGQKSRRELYIEEKGEQTANSSNKSTCKASDCDDAKRQDMNLNNNMETCKCRLSEKTKFAHCYDTHGKCSMDMARTSTGPVVKLPMNTRIVMRADNACTRPGKKCVNNKTKEKDIMSKIEAACCMDSACIERLQEMDRVTNELRSRACQLAHREAERVELLERAEVAWKDLEAGYRRRIALSEEKEEALATQAKILMEERNRNKDACMALSKTVKEKGDAAEVEKNKLVQVDKDMCDRACTRMKLSQEVAQSEAALVEQQIKVASQDRESKLKEEQTRRKLTVLRGELDSARGLTRVMEQSMREELASLKKQVASVSNKLLEEDSENKKINTQVDEFQQEKQDIMGDLEGCQTACDRRIQGNIDELKKKRDQLGELKHQVVECQCKFPIDESIEVKRTASLAAMCTCSPEDRVIDPCSCTSLRSQLLTNLLSDLFSGLQGELGGTGSMMPCQFLKCLEDKHNWDKSSNVKTNLRNFFSKLLIGELDIAIATSIEKYHARWVGSTCADAAREIPDPMQLENEGWQERAIERKAQKLATKLAEQLFKERADQLVKRAKEIVTSGPQPCDCAKPDTTAVFPCLVKPLTIGGSPSVTNTSRSSHWRRTHQDVTHIKQQIEDLKKDTIKKEDLTIMEDKITKLLQSSLEPEPVSLSTTIKDKTITEVENNNLKRNKNLKKLLNTAQISKDPVNHKFSPIRKKNDNNTRKITKIIPNISKEFDKSSKVYEKIGQTYAVNMCLCENPIEAKLVNQEMSTEISIPGQDNISFNENNSGDIIFQNPSIDTHSTGKNIIQKKTPLTFSCRSKCACFHKMPSTRSIDKLLDTLSKWKSNLNNVDNHNVKTVSKHIQNSIVTNMPKNNSKGENKLELSCSSDGIDKKSSKFAKSGNVLPTTESEYVGAIYLDNSNECCKDIQEIDEKNKVKNERNNLNSTIKCNMSVLGKKGSTPINKKLKSNSINRASGQSSLLSKRNISIESAAKTIHSNLQSVHNNIKKSDTHRETFSANNLSNTQINMDTLVPNTNDESIQYSKDTIMESDIHNIDDSTKIFNNPDYYIKFLGVTLANSSRRALDKKYEKNLNLEKYRKLEVPNQNNNCDSNSDEPKLPTLPISELPTKEYDELRKMIDESFRKQHNEAPQSQDIGLETRSSKDKLLVSKENCVCCNPILDESKELEVNTFQLLEEHLKGQFKKINPSYCKSSCISPDEVEKMFTSLIQKVKHVISESANELTCKCPQEQQIESSWNRAHSLLQEYLKTKIKRVQCLCVLPAESNQASILPNVLEKVHKLIEHDFERLKSFCKCNEMCLKIDHKNDISQRGTNDVENNTDYDTGRLCKLSSNRSINLTQSVSGQVIQCLEMETKSCDPIERGTKTIQTTEFNYNKYNKYCNFGPQFDCDCGTNNKRNELTFETSDFISSNNDITRHEIPIHITKSKNNNKELHQYVCLNSDKPTQVTHDNISAKVSSPYIGYTLGCTCDTSALGTCSCVMSNITKDQISNIWNATKEKIALQNTSYIMDSVQKRSQTKHVTYNSNNILSNNQFGKNVCDSQVDAHIEDDIYLKNSCTELNISYKTVNTSNDNSSASVPNSSPAADVFTDFGCLQNKLHECNRDASPHKICIRENVYKSEPYLSESTKLHKSLASDCDCAFVPMCHVKMLVKNIENKLLHSECTCDSLNSKVCPVHLNDSC